MILKAFRIKNYRSIVDTDWCNLSHDNITALIGQNEAGKTAVLEALMSFYKTTITKEIRRSDKSWPEVSCSFEIKDRDISEIFKDNRFSNGLPEKLKELGRINLRRIWTDYSSSTLQLEDPAVLEIFRNQELQEEEEEHKLDEFLEGILSEYENLNAKIALAEHEKTSADEKVKEAEKNQAQAQANLEQSTTNEEQKPVREEELAVTNKNLHEARRIQNAINEELAKNIQNKERLQSKYDLAIQRKSLKEKAEKIEKTIIADKQSMEELNQQLTGTTGEAQKKELEAKIEIINIKKKNQDAETELNQLKEELNIILSIGRKVIAGTNVEEARDKVKLQPAVSHGFVSKEEFIDKIIEFIPLFELFTHNSSVLPDQIDLEDIKNNNTEAKGIIGVQNLLKVAGINVDFFDEEDLRIKGQNIANINEKLTTGFQTFWSQKIGKKNKVTIELELKNYDITDPKKQGKPYLVFWTLEGRERLYPGQRSAGVTWFLSFYLQLKATVVDEERERLLLIDEPGLSLHIRAQEDVLKVFEDIKDKIQIIYTTHSPHLIGEIDTFYRILAVQRDTEEDEKSPTIIFNFHKLGAASIDTLSPLLVIMGARFSDQQCIKKRNNIILEEISAFYYFSSFFKLLAYDVDWSFLPATGNSNVPQLAYLLLGWGLEFIVVLDDDRSGRKIYSTLKKNLCGDDDKLTKKMLLKIKDKNGIEDLFSEADFVAKQGRCSKLSHLFTNSYPNYRHRYR